MLIVGIAGGTGSGKSTVVRKIKEAFPADIIIPGGGENDIGIGVLMSIIEKYLTTGKS